MSAEAPPQVPLAEGNPEDDKERTRFLLELEFVQCLANTNYLLYLAQNRYFTNPAFIEYLKYLRYWRKPEYSKYIRYPHCLHFLELLQFPQFREAFVKDGNVAGFVHQQQTNHWRFYRTNRVAFEDDKEAQEGTAEPLPVTDGDGDVEMGE
mmetsp:Transcript_17736/g.68804  ORF Transcript_17736/g.68804 Transcript_17736/m.68804 type:complete len:151 (+) Transcript_17736:48-500(+)